MAQDQTIVAGAHVNRPGGMTKKYYSTFPLSYPKLWTYRYAELGLIFTDNNVAKDAFHWRLPHTLQSKMLKAPMMQNMTMHKDAFWVAKQAILPNSWENLERYETKGDAAPDDANTVVYNFENKIRTNILTWKQRIKNGINNEVLVERDDENLLDKGLINEVLHMMTFAELFYSCGCLLNNAGHPMWNLWNNKQVTGGDKKETINNFGWWFDRIVEEIFNVTNRLLLGTNNSDIAVVKNNPVEGQIDIRTALCYLRDDPTFRIDDGLGEDITLLIGNINDLLEFSIIECQDIEDRPFNYERLCAYQLAVAQYYTNDQIDYVYTAELYRQLISTYIDNTATYNYNGIKIYYDWLSGHFMENELVELTTASGFDEPEMTLDTWNKVFAYFTAIFQIKRSLRFKDYFTGSRSQPLAVMDYNVAVNNNEVSVIDITKKTLWQKLGNAMNRVGNRIEKQVKELVGVDMKPDYHVPFWLGHTSDNIITPETENTGAAQFDLPETAQGIAITSRFNSNAGNYMFTANFDRKGVFLAITYFEIPRLYSKAVSKFFYKADKFDEYNPYTQFTGDQAIDVAEKDVRAPYGTPFGYTNHDMEYKQRFGVVGGGFIFDLPGWCYIADRTRHTNYADDKIRPDYIRALQTEIDELFQSLNGYSIDTWYHFIVKNTIDMTGKRPMAYNPAIGM